MVYDVNGDGNIDKGDTNFGKTLDKSEESTRKRRGKRSVVANGILAEEKQKPTKTFDIKKDVKRFLRKKRHTYSMPDISGLEEKNRRERLIDGPSMAELSQNGCKSCR